MGFGWLGTFRQGQWRSFRRFVLNERRDAESRLSVIEAELARIGEVTVFYASTTDAETGETTVTEQRTGFDVTPGTSLGKLVQAYIAQGGNPLDISLFLSPDSTFIEDVEDATTIRPTQPYDGVVYPQSGVPVPGVKYEGGRLPLLKAPDRQPRSDDIVASAVTTARKWVNTTIQHRLHDLEARIIKLCDLREQLQQERDAITMAVGGTVGALPTLDTDFFDEKLGVVKIIAAIDAVFYETDDDGVPDFSTSNTTKLQEYTSLRADNPNGEEDNTAL